jgi:toxin CptA
MTTPSTRWSSASGPFHIEWRPSRWLLAALLALTVLAPLAVLASEMPRVAAWPLAGLALAQGLLQCRREWRRPRRLATLQGGRRVLLDGVALDDAKVAWRGPIAVLAWRDGRRQRRLAWWPDTLPPARRRELRLAAPTGQHPRHGASVAP